MVTLILTAHNMGDVTGADFDAWAAHVTDRIDDACGFPVRVEQGPFSGPGMLFEDRIVGATDEQTETVREAVRAMWDEAAW
jgi:hypothetical protein